MSAAEPRSTSASLASPPAYFREVQSAFQRAAHRAGLREQHYQFGGHVVRLRFAGDALLPALQPAIEHLAIDATDADPTLTINLWDRASTGVAPPPCAGCDDTPTHPEETRFFVSSRINMALSIGVGTMHLYDPQTRTGLYCADRADRVPPWEIAAPVRTILAWWAPSFGAALAHGAAVGNERGGVMLAAKGGSGKSTTALACVEAGMNYGGDDYVLLAGGETPTIHSLYSSAKLVHAHLADKLPQLTRLAVEHPYRHDKAIMLLNRSHRAQLARQMKLRALVVPQLALDRPSSIEPLRAVEVLKALAPSSVLQIPGTGPAALAALAHVTQRAKGYRLNVGRNLGQLVQVIRELIEQDV